VFAAALIVKLAIDSGWLTQVRQVALAYLFGASLIGTGLLLLKEDRNYASLLPSAGIIIMYATTVAAYREYHLISFENALVITSALSAICILLSLKIKNEIYPIAAAVGAYLAPSILQIQTLDLPFTQYYFVYCTIAFAFISVWLRSRTLCILAMYLYIIPTTALGAHIQPTLLVLIFAAQFVIFTIANIAYSIIYKQPLTRQEAWTIFPALMIFYYFEYQGINQILPGTAAWYALDLIICLTLVLTFAKKLVGNVNLPSIPMLCAFIAIMFFHSVYLELLPSAYLPWVAIAIIFCAAWIPSKNMINASNDYLLSSLVLLLIIIIEYCALILRLLASFHLDDNVTAVGFFIAISALIINKRYLFDSQKNGTCYLLLACAHLLAVVCLYSDCTDISSLAVSASWLIYAILVLSIAFMLKNKTLANSALLVLCLSAAKALLFDASGAPTTIRILCLLITGIVLYGAGLLFRKFASWDNSIRS
jgi:hypothetical protein